MRVFPISWLLDRAFDLFWRVIGEAEPKVGARVKITFGDLIGEKGRYIGRTSYDPTACTTSSSMTERR
jgi:hypothetical protein